MEGSDRLNGVRPAGSPVGREGAGTELSPWRARVVMLRR